LPAIERIAAEPISHSDSPRLAVLAKERAGSLEGVVTDPAQITLSTALGSTIE
jgi:hypothetical protein